MHRRRTKIVERTERLTRKIGRGGGLVRQAEKIRFRGVIATYKLHDRALGNRTARRKYDQAHPELDDVQRRVLDELNRQDYAVVDFGELADAALEQRVLDEGTAFIEQVEERLAHSSQELRDEDKDYLVRRWGHADRNIRLDGPWPMFALSDRMLGIANAYLGMWSKLEYLDFWYSIPVAADSHRIQSQRWHRDFDDRHLLKAFLYLVDVDESTGPFEFVAGSARGGAMAELYPWYPLSPAYPKEDEFDRLVTETDVRTLTGNAGTLVLCNTSGFHRGGFATAKPRVLATATYCSPASLKALTERNYRLTEDAHRSLTAAQRYAVR